MSMLLREMTVPAGCAVSLCSSRVPASTRCARWVSLYWRTLPDQNVAHGERKGEAGAADSWGVPACAAAAFRSCFSQRCNVEMIVAALFTEPTWSNSMSPGGGVAVAAASGAVTTAGRSPTT
jgi:hypothetical protein